MKKNIFSVVCLAVLLVCMASVHFGCATPENIDAQQSDSTGIDITVSDVATQQSDSTDVNITVSDDGIKQSQPVVTVLVREPIYYTNQQEQEAKCGMHMYIDIDRKNKKLDECVLQVLYDPDVLQYMQMSTCPSPDIDLLDSEVILTEPGNALIKVSGKSWYYTRPICFHVLSNEEIDLDISLVSYTDEGGVRENAQLVVDMPVKVPVVKDLSED